MTVNATKLANYRSQNRVLLVFAPSTKDKNYLAQKRLLEAVQSGLSERDMVVFFVTDLSDPLRADYNVTEAFTVILIGKDGTEKERFPAPMEPLSLFAIIDQMPMRRREMSE